MCAELRRLLDRSNPNSEKFDASFANLKSDLLKSSAGTDLMPEIYHLSDRADYIEIVLSTICDSKITEDIENLKSFARTYRTISALPSNVQEDYRIKYPSLYKYLTELDRICGLVD